MECCPAFQQRVCHVSDKEFGLRTRRVQLAVQIDAIAGAEPDNSCSSGIAKIFYGDRLQGAEGSAETLRLKVHQSGVIAGQVDERGEKVSATLRRGLHDFEGRSR